MSLPGRHLGQVAFEAYVREAGGLLMHGRPVTNWEHIGPTAQAAFYAAALSVLNTALTPPAPAKRRRGRPKKEAQPLSVNGFFLTQIASENVNSRK